MKDSNQLNIKREASWMVARRYASLFHGRIIYNLTVEDDICYLCKKNKEVIAWVKMIIPKSYA